MNREDKQGWNPYIAGALTGLLLVLSVLGRRQVCGGVNDICPVGGAYPALKATVLTWGNFGKITLPQLLGINHWPVIAVFVVLGLLLFRWFEKKGL